MTAENRTNKKRNYLWLACCTLLYKNITRSHMHTIHTSPLFMCALTHIRTFSSSANDGIYFIQHCRRWRQWRPEINEWHGISIISAQKSVNKCHAICVYCIRWYLMIIATVIYVKLLLLGTPLIIQALRDGAVLQQRVGKGLQCEWKDESVNVWIEMNEKTTTKATYHLLWNEMMMIMIFSDGGGCVPPLP